MDARLRTLLVKAAAEVVKTGVKALPGGMVIGPATGGLTDTLAQGATDKIWDEASKAITRAFVEADKCFARQCGDDDLVQAILSLPLACLPRLEQLARRIPDTLDITTLGVAIQDQFREDWSNKLTPAQLEHASTVYMECLTHALAAHANQLLPIIYNKVEETRQATSEILANVLVLRAEVGTARQFSSTLLAGTASTTTTDAKVECTCGRGAVAAGGTRDGSDPV